MASCAATFQTWSKPLFHFPSVLLRRRRRILLAEDDSALRKLIREAFELKGYSVTECKDGRELLWALKKDDGSDLAAVVSDNRMPGVDGVDVLSELGSRRPKVPFILITAFGDDDVHRLAKQHGADLVVDKPLDEDELVEMVRAFSRPA